MADPRHVARTTFRIKAAGPFLLALSMNVAANAQDAETLFRSGEYDACARAAADEARTGFRGEAALQLQVRALLARGNDEDALATLEAALARFPASVALRMLGRDVYRANDKDADAAGAVDAVEALVRAAPARYTAPADRVALGRFFLARGADARQVLDQCYDPVTKAQPDYVDAHLATAELALDKQDYALAASTLEKAPKDARADPRYHSLLARAFASDDRAKSAKALDEALKLNPKHVDSLLMQADQLIDSERYADAAERVKRATDVNPREPRAWAYLAVLAHLRSDPEAEASARSLALTRWPKDPSVDHLIGRKLSQEYRFAEGAACQRRALAFDPGYMPAKVQLCQDLLRLGDETEGWKLADEVVKADAYNVVAFNLVTLRDRLAGFRTLESDGFILRMDAREADLYGRRVVALLKQAKQTLAATYRVTVPGPVTVEIFPQKKEFAVRTFGVPGADGLLGVCFGPVVTANSPASQGETPANWEAVLWHEFCHVVTLTKTRNKMPRWLSEGISVYEERKHDPAWGMAFSPAMRKMVVADSLTPLSKLSSAFLAPASPLHLQFAYFESSLAVEYLVASAGPAALNGLLDDLGAGVTLNVALPSRTGMTLDQLDEGFAKFARAKAAAIAPGATWDEPELPPDADSAALSAWLETHPKSVPGLIRLGEALASEKKWAKLREAATTLKSLYPGYVGPENPYVLLAAVAKHDSDPAAERRALEELSERDGDVLPAYARLAELDEAEGDWKKLARDAKRALAVNPLIPAPHRRMALAAEKLGDREESLASYRAFALLDETDPAGVHYRLAGLLRQSGKNDEARREVLKALEDAPRFLDAHRLLLELDDQARAKGVKP